MKCTACTMASLAEQGVLRSKGNAEVLHGQCVGGSCDCGCPSSRLPHCSECGRPRLESELANGECSDATDCAAEIARRFEAVRRFEAARARARVAVTAPPRPVKAPPAPQRTPVGPKGGRCHCCGEATRGGRFLPGHDARLKTALTRGALSGDVASLRELMARWPKWAPRNDQTPMTEQEVEAATLSRWGDS